MKTRGRTLDPAVVRQQAERWYTTQRSLAAKCLGTSWPEHQTWVENYLKQELRDRLVAMGWPTR